MKKFKFFALILLISIFVSVVAVPPAAAVSDPSTASKAVMIMDAATGNVIYSKNEGEKAYPASITKIMTVLLAVEAVERGEVSLTDQVTASGNFKFDLIEDGSTGGLVVGETMSLENLMYCAMVQSANDACNVIAEYISGSVSSFVVLMNQRATELGCTGTNFANTHGLPNTNHYTTAADFGHIALEAYKHPTFMNICNTPKVTIPATNKSDVRNYGNTNGLINPDSQMYKGYIYEGAAGMKTGHTSDAGYCLVSTATKGNVSFICVVMGGVASGPEDNKQYSSFTDTIALYNWAFENFSYRDIVKTIDLIEDVPVAMGSNGDYVTVHPQNPVIALLANDDNMESFEQKIVIFSKESGEELIAPIEAGQVLGEISIIKDGVNYGTTPLVASTSIDLSYSGYIKSRIGQTLRKPLVIIILVILLALLGAYIYLVVRYRASKKQYVKQQSMRRRQQQKTVVERQPVKTAGIQSKTPPITYFEAPSEEELPSEEKPQDSLENQAERDYFEEFFSKK